MKICGHTLGTSNMFLSSALRLFRAVGLDGAEIIWQNDYPSAIPEDASEQMIREVRTLARDLNLRIVCLTPYMTGINSLDDTEREKDIARFERCIQVAEQLDCLFIRVYAGSYLPGEETLREVKWQRLVEAMRFLGGEAETAGVTLCVENHFNTMTVTAAETAALMEAVNAPGVGILYDQVNLDFTHSESYREAIDLQKPWIRHVHVKDMVFVDRDKPFKAASVAKVEDGEDRAVRSRVVGEGIMDWPAILSYLLESSNYAGYLSLEYEYRWHPNDLLVPEEGFERSAKYLRQVLANLEKVQK